DDLRCNLREDLHVLIMSATLDCERIAALLDDAPVIRAEGKMFPVEEHWSAPFGDPRKIGERAAAAVRTLLDREEGNFLVFLPGAREIECAAEALADLASPQLRIAPLYGNLEKKEQDAAVAIPPQGVRKVVLATNIAESSLTIDGVRVVIDSGLEKVMRYSPASGIPHLEMQKISRASAQQRAGRAGRLAPGAVYRLYDESAYRAMREFAAPEIREADLTPLALELAQWGATPDQLRWLDPPPEGNFAAAQEILRDLSLLDSGNHLTAAGREAGKFAVHPRLAAMLLRGKTLGMASLAAELAALIGERDPLPFAESADIRLRLEYWRSHKRHFPLGTILRDQLLRVLHIDYREESPEEAGVLIAAAFPERIARQRAPRSSEYLLASGRGAALQENDPLRTAPFLAAAGLDGSARAAIRLAAPLTEAEIRQHFANRIRRRERVFLEGDRVAAAAEETLGAVILKSSPLSSPPPEAAAELLADAVARGGLHLLNLDKNAQVLRERVNFAHRQSPEEWQDWSDEGLCAALPELLQLLPEAKSLRDLARADWRKLLEIHLGFPQLQRLDREYPERFETPAGSRLRIDYTGETATLPVKLQEMFGVTRHPALGGGRIPLRIELLSPAQRPVQITSDLPRFWRENYALVQKEMKSRYPKHFWPDDPAGCAATSRTLKPKKS
ncbi:MAG: ATP-dependent helicase HrpB, partial [Lentisphaeria bacterium]|nr:ATP-dependent helicase HrpB [Lentisphaeria bacterium]